MSRSELPRGRRLLMVASTGGHLAQLNIFSDLLSVAHDSHWVTFPNAQSASLMHGRSHTLVDYVGPRQLWAALRTTRTFLRLLRSEPFDAVVSTGAAVAVPAMVSALVTRTPAYYIESVSRVRGPSLTGRILRCIPGVTTFTQHATWSSKAWRYELSVFDAFVRTEDAAPLAAPGPVTTKARSTGQVTAHARHSDRVRIFVSLGTIRPYRFDALVDAVVAATAGLPVDLVWQLGETSRDNLPGEVHKEMRTEEFEAAVEEADIVITHAGVATCLRLVQIGVHAIVVPRRATRGEHVDDHQEQIATDLAERGLCTVAEAPEIEGPLIERLAAYWREAEPVEGVTAISV